MRVIGRYGVVHVALSWGGDIAKNHIHGETDIRDFKIYDGKPRLRRPSNKIIRHTKHRE